MGIYRLPTAVTSAISEQKVFTDLVMFWEPKTDNDPGEQLVAVFDKPVTVDDLRKHFINSEATDPSRVFTQLLTGNAVTFTEPDGTEITFRLVPFTSHVFLNPDNVPLTLVH